jgi:excisionase family DNA binding protein
MNETTTSVSNSAGKSWKTKREIASHLKCNIRTVTKLMKRRILPFVKIGRIVRLDLDECDRAMEKYKSKSLFE